MWFLLALAWTDTLGTANANADLPVWAPAAFDFHAIVVSMDRTATKRQFRPFASTAKAHKCACTTFASVLPSAFVGGGASRVFPLVPARATLPPSAHLCVAPFSGGNVCASCHVAGDGGGG
eukprot:CAMPEP_0183823926 /NCGR_PEP_ID=MMETSP0807_2-20130328/312_1 /TAXON_ID=88271 /ORGANISM="Picocystis salinarum, Strain CCMP1897" /LENGTH=120 /DNA_ID=CAMNT_0026068833 /DNA_START=267 /DNA_END=627 /DNA_ORIENTATION=-